jgi:hypothetical protein
MMRGRLDAVTASNQAGVRLRCGSRAGPEGALVCLGRYAVNPREVSSHLVGRPEAARGGDAIDRVVGVLEQVLGAADSFGAHPLQRCGAGRLAEASGVGVAGAVVGILLLFAGNGGVSVAETTLPSGIAAVLVATVPLWMIVFAWPLQHQRITVRAAAGLAVGLGGVAILVGGGTASGRLTGVLIVLGASAAWGFGSVLSHRLALPDNALLAAAIEMLAGGAVLLAVAAGSGEFSRVQWSSLPASSWIALTYLIGPGSILAFTAYGYALSHLPVTTGLRQPRRRRAGRDRVSRRAVHLARRTWRGPRARLGHHHPAPKPRIPQCVTPGARRNS